MAAPSSGYSLPRERPSSAKDTLARFSTLLGTFRLKDADEGSRKRAHPAFVPNNDALAKLLQCESGDCRLATLPSLSLATLSGEPHATSTSNKHEVEAHAALNLSRPLIVLQSGHSRPITGTESHVEQVRDPLSETEGIDQVVDHDGITTSSLAPFWTDDVTAVPSMMLENLAASLSLLIDARLRAYVTILARHGVSVAECPVMPDAEKEEALLAVERKLSRLADIGAHITVENMVTTFHAAAPLGVCRDVNGSDEVILPLSMAAVMDISIPRWPSGDHRVTLAVKTGGVIGGTFEKDTSLLKSVQMELDTHKLLSNMVDKAARVIAIALDHVNDVSAMIHAPPLCVSEVLFQNEDASVDGEMPPPKPRFAKYQEAANFKGPTLPVVSPDLNALLTPYGPSVPPLLLLDSDSSTLSPECCANIVDFVIGELNDDFMTPTFKKSKLDGAPMV